MAHVTGSAATVSQRYHSLFRSWTLERGVKTDLVVAVLQHEKDKLQRESKPEKDVCRTPHQHVLRAGKRDHAPNLRMQMKICDTVAERYVRAEQTSRD